ncbi:hypothetical protein [Halalkalicoccus tibetensis]|uniref:Uncharacterized protein n=1 Tax=Halalkalicoccus tibetensis TaxID=175632 RepID=A0ABD5V724_9EURY
MDYDGLTSAEDGRQQNPDLDSYRLGNFKQGWTRAIEGQQYESVLDELKWNNLGWRLGKLFGPTSDELREEMFKWCVEQQKDEPTK